MEAQVNPHNVSKEFDRLVNENLDFDKDESLKPADTIVAQFLFDKFAKITCKYDVKKAIENFSGSDERLQRYLGREAGKDEKDWEEKSESVDPAWKDVDGTEIIEEKFCANEGKNWKFDALRRRFPDLKDRSCITRWKQQVVQGGTKYEKYEEIDEFVWSIFQNTRANYRAVRDIDLRVWALEKSGQFQEFSFKASQSWAENFKRKHKISSRKIQKKTKCDHCDRKPFICCSWCDNTICFEECFHDYHVMVCSKSPFLQADTYTKPTSAVTSNSEKESENVVSPDVQNQVEVPQVTPKASGRKPSRGRALQRANKSRPIPKEQNLPEGYLQVEESPAVEARPEPGLPCIGGAQKRGRGRPRGSRKNE
ncbi:unnamed protein product [Allacma fusca]|uniref:HTH CENPB-type domain-containing protein n=1 Tax=Allacma fusca TaxID=39272 RepID=A0A8J2L288_9HEXA|nr:unnamed protein product [Allacma fusca]